MKAPAWIRLGLVVIILLAGCLLFVRKATSVSSEVTNDVATANNSFGLHLYSEIKSGAENVVYSPFSVSTLLTMTMAGARGETARQMAAVLQVPPKDGTHDAYASLLKEFSLTTTQGCHLAVANSVWIQKGFSVTRSFQKTVQRYLGYEAEADFATAREAARQEINAWVARQTKDKIRELIKEGMIDPETELVLVNTISFEGKWRFQFVTSETQPSPFHKTNGESVVVPMMNKNLRLQYVETDELQFLEMPFVDTSEPWKEIFDRSQFSMVLLLPKDPDGVISLESSLKPEQIEALQAASSNTEVSVSLPKFRIILGFDLKNPLEKMGMTDAFSGQADFSGIANGEGLFIGCIRHQASINVHESGCEAVAATVLNMTRGGFHRGSLAFNANHPFLFAIRHNPTGLILFMGRVGDPSVP